MSSSSLVLLYLLVYKNISTRLETQFFQGKARKRAASHCALGQSRRSGYTSPLRVQKAREQDHVTFDSCASRLTVCSEVEQVPSSSQSNRTPILSGSTDSRGSPGYLMTPT